MVWGLAWLGFRSLHGLGVHPLWSTALVFAVATALLVLLRPASVRGLLANPRLLALMLSAGLTNVCFNWAVSVGDVVRVTLLFYVMPLWSLGLAWCLLGERPTRAGLVRLALALLGLWLVVRQPGSWLPWPRDAADALALAAGFGFALTNALLRLWRHTPTQARVLAMFGGGALTATALALALPVATAPVLLGAGAQPAAWLWLLGMTLALVGANFAQQYGVARLSAQTAALILLSEVLFATVSSVWLGVSQPQADTWVGGALIVLAALLAVLRPGR